MSFLRTIEGKSSKDRIRNGVFTEQSKIKLVPAMKIQERPSRKLGPLNRLSQGRLTSRACEGRVQGYSKQKQTKKNMEEEVKQAAKERSIQQEEIGQLLQDKEDQKNQIKSTLQPYVSR